MEESQKKILSIVLAVVCLAAAGFIVYKTYFSPDDRQIDTKILKCEACGDVVELSIDDFTAKWNEIRSEISPLVPAVFECEKCGKRALKPANVCKKCGEIFNLNSVKDDYADKCPKCGYSRTEELVNE